MIQIMVVLVVLAGFGWWWSGPGSDESVLYPAHCKGGELILPLTTLAPNAGDSEKFLLSRANCVIVTHEPTVYKLNNARTEAYYSIGAGPPGRLIHCMILSRTDWACSYPAGGAKVVVNDGLRAIRTDGATPLTNDVFYQRRWQWWIATLWAGLGGEPKGTWMIPEQKAYYEPPEEVAPEHRAGRYP